MKILQERKMPKTMQSKSATTLCEQIKKLSNSQGECLVLIFLLGLLLILFASGIYCSIQEQRAMLACLATFVFTIILGADIFFIYIYARDASKLRLLKRQRKRLELLEFLQKELIHNKQ